MTPEQTTRLFQFAHKIFNLSIDVVGDAKLEITQQGARDPKIIALALLSRTITNFKGVTIMLREGLEAEARTLTRCCFENLIYIGALHKDGSAFVELLLNDEAASRRQRGKFLLARSVRMGKHYEWEPKLTAYLDEQEKKYPKAKFLRPKEVAEGTIIPDTYVYYSQLSADSAHTSISSLGLHVGREVEDGELFLRLTVAPGPGPERVYETLDSACDALIAVCITANEMVGGTPAGLKLRSAFDEFVAMREDVKLHEPKDDTPKAEG
jgi:hypothetical protein